MKHNLQVQSFLIKTEVLSLLMLTITPYIYYDRKQSLSGTVSALLAIFPAIIFDKN